jgi:hypothetical protein
MTIAEEIKLLADKIQKCEDRKVVINKTIDKYFEKISQLQVNKSK